MKIFVLGSTGMLGRYLYTYLLHRGFDVVGISRREIDAAKINSCSINTIGGISPGDVIINCIGI